MGPVDLNLVATGIVGVAGTLGGSYLGVWLVQRAQRSRPVLIPESVAFDVAEVPAGRKATVNQTLVTQCDDSPFVRRTVPGQAGSGVPESEYISYLQNAILDVERSLVLLPEYSRYASELRRELAAGNWAGLDYGLSHCEAIIVPYLEGETARDAFHFSTQEPDWTGKKAAHPIVEGPGPTVDDTPRTTVTVSLPGVGNVVLISRPTYHPSYQQSLDFLRRFARAIVYRNAQDLNDLFTHLDAARGTWEPLLRQLKTDLIEELARIRRIRVEGRIGNAGGSAFSVLPNCVLALTLTIAGPRAPTLGDQKPLSTQVLRFNLELRERGGIGSEL